MKKQLSQHFIFITSPFSIFNFACFLTKNIAAFSRLCLAHKCKRESPFESIVYFTALFDEKIWKTVTLIKIIFNY